MSTENQRAGMGAILAACAGLAAVIGIVIAANQGTTRPSEDEPRSERTTERRSSSARFSSFPMGDPASAAGERAARTASDAGTGPEGGVPSAPLSEEARLAAFVEPTGVMITPPEPPPTATARVELTPEQRYEAHAFLVDLVTLRIDTLRTEVAEARASGDAMRLRRLEPALAVLEEEVVSLRARSRELERGLGRSSAPPEAEAEAEGPAEGEAEGTEGEAEGTEGEASE